MDAEYSRRGLTYVLKADSLIFLLCVKLFLLINFRVLLPLVVILLTSPLYTYILLTSPLYTCINFNTPKINNDFVQHIWMSNSTRLIGGEMTRICCVFTNHQNKAKLATHPREI